MPTPGQIEVHHFSTLLARREVTIAGETEVKADFVIEGTAVISGFLLDAVSKLPLPITGQVQIGLLAPDDEWIERTYRGKITHGYFEVNRFVSGTLRYYRCF